MSHLIAAFIGAAFVGVPVGIVWMRFCYRDWIPKSQAYYWTAEWQRGEAEADADIKAGRVKRYESYEAFLADMEIPEA